MNSVENTKFTFSTDDIHIPAEIHKYGNMENHSIIRRITVVWSVSKMLEYKFGYLKLNLKLTTKT